MNKNLTIMAISNDLKKGIERGDYSEIARIFTDKHKRSGETVTPRYVQMIFSGERVVSPGTKAEEVVRIKIDYVRAKKKMKKEILKRSIAA
jgi:hypothetical protein